MKEWIHLQQLRHIKLRTLLIKKTYGSNKNDMKNDNALLMYNINMHTVCFASRRKVIGATEK